MGLPASSDISVDLLPMLFIAMSMKLIKNAFQSFMQVLGLLSAVPVPGDTAPSLEFPDEYSFCSGLMLPGFSEKIRRALPLTKYDPDAHTGAQALAGVECSVCLQEFRKEQVVCCLPACKHAFHWGCVDSWLDHEQTTCPLCRTSIVPEEISIKQRQRQQQLSEEFRAWFSSTHGPGFQGLWCYN